MKLKRLANSFQNTNSATATKAQVAKVSPDNTPTVANSAGRERGPSGQHAAIRAKGGSHQQAAARSKTRPMPRMGRSIVGASSAVSPLNASRPILVSALSPR